MITTTTPEYIEIWLKLLPNMMTLSLQGTIFLSLALFIRVLITWLIPTSRFQKTLTQGTAVLLEYPKGWFYYGVVLSLYFSWGAFILPPIIGFIPTVYFDVKLLVFHWFSISLIILLVLYYMIISKFHRKLALPEYYISNRRIGLRRFGNDLIIPFNAVEVLNQDCSLLRIAIKFRCWYLWRRTPTIYQQFSTKESFNEFIKALTEINGVKWQEKPLSSIKVNLSTFFSLQRLNEVSLKEQLPPRTLKILEAPNIS